MNSRLTSLISDTGSRAAVILKSGMAKNVTVLTMSSLATRAIALLSLPVITRIYSPGDFGEFSIFVAALGLALPFTTLKLSAAIPLPKYETAAINLLALCVVFTFGVTILSVAGIAPVMLLSLRFDWVQPIALWVLAFGILGGGMLETLNSWALRRRRFDLIARASVSQSISSVIIKLILGLLHMQSVGLLIGQAASSFLGVLAIVRVFPEDLGRTLRKISVRRLRVVFRRYNAFPRYRLPAQFLLVFSVQMPILFFGLFQSIEAAGQLGLALTCIAVPISLISNSVGQVFYAEIANLSKLQPVRIKGLIVSFLSISIVIIILPVVLLATLGPSIFAFVFGTEWILAGSFAQLLSLYLGIQFCAVPLINTLSVFDDQKSFLIINGSRVLLSFSVFLVSYLVEFGVETTIFLYSSVLAIHYLYVIRSIFSTVNRECLKIA